MWYLSKGFFYSCGDFHGLLECVACVAPVVLCCWCWVSWLASLGLLSASVVFAEGCLCLCRFGVCVFGLFGGWGVVIRVLGDEGGDLALCVSGGVGGCVCGGW